jgi:DNA modification methylase
MSDEKFYNFLYDAYVSMYSAIKLGGGIYVCHADSEGLNFRRAFKESGFNLTQCIIWVKNTIVMGRQDHHWQHEPILYGWKPGASHKWHGGRKQTTVIQPSEGVTINKLDNKTTQITLMVGLQKLVFNVGKYEVLDYTDDTGTSIWKVDKPQKNVDHPTKKPLKLCAKAIKNSSLSGEIVLDLFGGSGSTLMAAEQLERRAFLMELDPVYVDVIVKRWEEFTDKKAIRVGE